MDINTLRVSDLGCATALTCDGYLPLELVQKTSSNKVYFIFEKHKAIEFSIKEYWSGRHTSVSRTYFENLRMLKNQIYTHMDTDD